MDISVAAQKTLALIDKSDLPENHPYYGKNHIAEMCNRIIDGEIAGEKAHRWLGWAQCAICMGGAATLPELKAINYQA